jgi:3-hydroxyisobutyrate dehydrogenase-like beta-hydroxyacid dehydrogenase
MSPRVGFVGLGTQGKPIAAHFAPRGFDITVYDIAPDPVAELVREGAKAAETPREVGANADVVGVCVPEDKHVLAVSLGDDGLLAGMQPGAVLLIHSTVLPETIDAVAAEAADRGIEVMDACVTGGPFRAVARQVTYLIGGSSEALEKARFYFETTTDIPPVHAGDLGTGAKLKLCINLITYTQFAAAVESMKLARAVGLPQEVLEEAGRSNGQLTELMIAFLGAHKAPEEVRTSDDFQTMLRRNMLIAEKDLAWALQLGRQSGISLPIGGLISQSMASIFGVIDEGRR